MDGKNQTDDLNKNNGQDNQNDSTNQNTSNDLVIFTHNLG